MSDLLHMKQNQPLKYMKKLRPILFNKYNQSACLFAMIIVLLLANVGHTQQAVVLQPAVTIKILNFSTGRPIDKVAVTVTFWNGKSLHGQIPPKNIVHETSSKTNKRGEALIIVPKNSFPEHMSVFYPELEEAYSPDFSLREVLSSGEIVPYRHYEKSANSVVSAKPGIIIIFNRKLTARDRIRREIP